MDQCFLPDDCGCSSPCIFAAGMPPCRSPGSSAGEPRDPGRGLLRPKPTRGETPGRFVADILRGVYGGSSRRCGVCVSTGGSSPSILRLRADSGVCRGKQGVSALGFQGALGFLGVSVAPSECATTCVRETPSFRPTHRGLACASFGGAAIIWAVRSVGFPRNPLGWLLLLSVYLTTAFRAIVLTVITIVASSPLGPYQ